MTHDEALVYVGRILQMPLVFTRTGDGEFPYVAKVDERVVTIRINDFPAEPLYSILVGDQVLADLEDWPPAWPRPDIHLGGRDN